MFCYPDILKAVHSIFLHRTVIHETANFVMFIERHFDCLYFLIYLSYPQEDLIPHVIWIFVNSDLINKQNEVGDDVLLVSNYIDIYVGSIK